MRFDRFAKATLIAAGVCVGAGIGGLGLGHFAEGDAFYFYKQSDFTAPEVWVPQAAASDWSYPIRPIEAPALATITDPYVDDSFPVSPSYEAVSFHDAYPADAEDASMWDVAGLDAGEAVVSAVTHHPLDKHDIPQVERRQEDEWEAVGDTARLISAVDAQTGPTDDDSSRGAASAPETSTSSGAQLRQ